METSILDKYKNPMWTPTAVTTPQTFKPTPISSLGNSMTTSNIPAKTDLTSQFKSSTTGAITGAMTPPATYTTPSGATVDVNGNVITPATTETPKTPTSAEQTPWYQTLANMVQGQPKPTSLANQYSQIAEQQGLSTAQKDVADLQAQLNAITAQTQAGQLGLETQDVRRTGTVLDRMQGQIAREQAIKALPISAALNAAQGRLQAAQSNIETLLNLTQKDQEAQYQYQKDQINYAMQFADAKQKEYLLKRTEELDAKKSTQDQLDKTKQTYINAAIQAGDYTTAGKLATATNFEQLSTMASGIKGSNLDDVYKQLQIQKLRQDIAGTTEATKPATAAQLITAGYAERVASANDTIDLIGNKFTGTSSYFAGLLPNALKSSDRQQFEQAKRNFINAVLRRESGAAIAPSEFDSAEIQYFPQPGDSAAVLEQKKQNRLIVQNNLVNSSGTAYSTKVTSNDPLGLFK